MSLWGNKDSKTAGGTVSITEGRVANDSFRRAKFG